MSRSAVLLNDEKILTPLEFKNLRKRQNRKELRQERKYWQQGTVRNILTNEIRDALVIAVQFLVWTIVKQFSACKFHDLKPTPAIFTTDFSFQSVKNRLSVYRFSINIWKAASSWISRFLTNGNSWRNLKSSWMPVAIC